MYEGHTFPRNDSLARMAWLLPMPYEVNFLLNSSWFAPLGDAPPSHLSEAQVLAARFGQPRRATLAGAERPTRIERAGRQIRLVVTPAPVASVVLE